MSKTDINFNRGKYLLTRSNHGFTCFVCWNIENITGVLWQPWNTGETSSSPPCVRGEKIWQQDFIHKCNGLLSSNHHPTPPPPPPAILSSISWIFVAISLLADFPYSWGRPGKNIHVFTYYGQLLCYGLSPPPPPSLWTVNFLYTQFKVQFNLITVFQFE